MVSRIHFVILDNKGKQHPGSVTLRQQAGGDYQDDLEVGSLDYASDAPQLQYQEFRDLVERYYRRLVGPTGTAIRIGPGARNIRMRNNLIESPMPFEVAAVEGAARGTW